VAPSERVLNTVAESGERELILELALRSDPIGLIVYHSSC